MSEPRNAKGKTFSWSYTALTDFEGCPARYAESRFYCRTPFVETEAIIWGNRVHKAAEDFIKRTPNKDIEALLPVEPYVTAMIRSGHKLQAEREIALTRQLTPVSWFSEKAWLRVKIDVTMFKGKFDASVFDFKTGKMKDDEDQLRICIAALAVLEPHIQRFDGKYIWIAHKQVTGIKPVTRDEVKGIWQEFIPRVKRMEDAWAAENFPAKPSGLCPWCSVSDCKQRRGERRV